MDKKQAQAIIKETFEAPFDKGKFTNFIINLLNLKTEQIEHKHPYSGNFIPDSYEESISTLERIAKYTDGEHKIDILIVKLKKETSIERARTMQRNFIAWYLNGSRGGVLKDAALVAFVSPNEEDWRFSLVKMDYRFEEGRNGRMRVREEFTPARRWSFLVGKNEKSHTAQNQLVDRLADDENNPTLAQLEEAFNIETVTREFFEGYRGLFLWTKETLDDVVKKDKKIKADFEDKSVNTVDFSKKLLGQIVFLYFLQKKGWFGVKRDADWGTGPKNFLRELFEGKHSTYKNFFNDILESLFYDALARDRSDIDHWNDQFKCKIPFLNGGLFDPINNYDWAYTDILLPNDLFSNTYKTKEGDTGNGILDIFDRYNFTVKEDEPLEKEVAIDPELLGKAYEKFNAIRPDNYEEYKKALKSGQKGAESQFNKQYGVYYTPRQIVHYMCQQSLINYLATEIDGKVSKEAIEFLILKGEEYIEYLKTAKEKKEEGVKSERYKENEYFIELKKYAQGIDDALSNIRVCDPAVGSGAFPVGMMTEIVKARLFFSETKCLDGLYKNKEGDLIKRNAYNFKRDCIQNSLYGIDIDPGAVEIAKLRLWLSLIVDEEDIEQIKPLPNLDYKIMQGNSLIEDYEGIKLIDERFFEKQEDQNEIIKKLQIEQNKLQKEYIDLHTKNQLTPIKKIELEKRLNELNKQIKNLQMKPSNHQEAIGLFGPSEAQKKASQLLELQKQFFGTALKKEKDKLKVEIEGLNWELIEVTLKEQGKESKLKEIIQFQKANTKPFFLWKLHFADVFQEKDGFDVVIANPPYIKEYVNRSVFDGLRNSPYYQGKMDLWYLFACKGIDISKNSSGIITFIAQNNWITSHGASKMRNKVITDAQILSLIDFGDFKIFEAGIQTMVMMFKKNTDLDNYAFDYRRLHGTDLELKDIVSLFNKEDNVKAEYFTPTITRSSFLDRTLTFSNSDVEPILEKIKVSANFRLDPKKEVAQGIVCPQDYVNKSSQKVLGDNFKVGEGIFILSDKELKAFKLSKKELLLIKPLYTTDELNRWWGNAKNRKWIIYTDSSFKNKKKIEEYPAIKMHLDRFTKVITSDNKPFGLHRARDAYFFTGEKILVVRKCARPTFTYTNFDSYVTATFYVIKSERINQQYLTGLLNSKLIAFWLKHRGKMQGTNYQIDKEPIIALPILKPDKVSQDAIAKIVTGIINILKSEGSDPKQTKVKEYERQIDQMVYKLYGLTREEIKIVEDFDKK